MSVKIIECPRDAMQGLSTFVPTDVKATYINSLLRVGYHTIDCGSFVSPRAIPQMRDTRQVLEKLDMEATDTKLSVIVANERGVDDAVREPKVTYLGFPFSISEEFQQRNTRRSMQDASDTVQYLAEKADKYGKEVVIYISMGFGNPYGDDWSPTLVEDWVGQISEIGIHSFSISDTVGVGNAETIAEVFSRLLISFPGIEFGAHFHTRPESWYEKVDAAYRNGCKRFDGAINGYGGCPMANDELVGNMSTENLLNYFDKHQVNTALNREAFEKSRELAASIF